MVVNDVIAGEKIYNIVVWQWSTTGKHVVHQYVQICL